MNRNRLSESAGRTVLVLTEPGDTTADLVAGELDRRDVPVFRADTADFPLSLQVSAQFDGGWRGEICGRDGSVDLRDIRSVYVRRPTEFVLPASMPDAEQRFATREARRGLGGLLLSLPCTWVNHPSRAADAEYKPFQLAIAAACGLSVPRTVVTNVPGDADEHRAFLGSEVVYKTLASAVVSDGQRPSVIYTTDVTQADLADRRVALTAHQFQQRIPKVRDVRATVVGRRVFAANILTGSATASGRLDWRRDYPSLRYEPTRLPPEVETSLLALTGRLGLSFAVADFVVTEGDQHYFVDLNPGGQWGWIQEATGLPIGRQLPRNSWETSSDHVIELDGRLQHLADELNQGLIEELVRKGTLSSPAWRAAFAAVPRHLFVPRFTLPDQVGRPALDVADLDRREDWLRAAYQAKPLLTDLEELGIATTSCSAPAVVAIMLESSEVAEGQSVLEVGTGTGWTAGLLAHRLGSGAVTSVDIKPACVAQARERLQALGLTPTLAAGDGYQGYEPRAPYDRIIATASLRRVPPAWTSQVRPGGKILVDLRAVSRATWRC